MNAQLTLIHEIDNAIAQSSGDRRGQMARHLTDLFLVNSDKYSDDEIALIDEVFVRLIVTIEESSRALLASRLGPMSKAPPKILRALACDDAIDVASSVLMHSERLDDLTVIECAKTKSQDHLFAISRRKILPEAVTEVLVERGDQQVVLSTAQNAGAKFSNKGFTILVKRSNGDDRLAICVGTRPDIPPQLFGQLLEAASETVRSKLEAESPHAKREIDRVVIDVAARIRTQATIQPQEYAAAQVLVDLLKRSGQLNAAKLETFAKADRFEETLVALAVMSGIPTDVVARELNDKFAEFILILAKAIGLSWPTTRTILTLGARKHQCAVSEIEQGLIDFQRLKRQSALQILACHRTNERTGAL
jgi:uncharacterized protein (DUF2336 family)